MENIPTGHIAPCGMDCRLCRAFQRTNKNCTGCRMESAGKPKRCRNCPYVNCEYLPEAGFCSECGKFPCSRLRAFDKRYHSRYNMSLIGNLKDIAAIGIELFIISQSEKWKCPNCGSLLCVHEPVCLACGNTNVYFPENK